MHVAYRVLVGWCRLTWTAELQLVSECFPGGATLGQIFVDFLNTCDLAYLGSPSGTFRPWDIPTGSLPRSSSPPFP